jgi:hypothetical protein
VLAAVRSLILARTKEISGCSAGARDGTIEQRPMPWDATQAACNDATSARTPDASSKHSWLRFSHVLEQIRGGPDLVQAGDLGTGMWCKVFPGKKA